MEALSERERWENGNLTRELGAFALTPLVVEEEPLLQELDDCA